MGEIKSIAVCGLGKLGSPIACAFAASSVPVIALDVDEKKVEALKNFVPPVIEPELKEYLELDEVRRHLRATTSIEEAVKLSDACLFVTPTPSASDGSFDHGLLLKAMTAVVKEVSRKKRRKYTFVVNSTVMPSFLSTQGAPLLRRHLNGLGFGLVYKPEFIALGTVIKDLHYPDLLLIGENSEEAGERVECLYRQMVLHDCQARRMSLVEAELAKISLNCYVTMKISFANQLGQVARRFDADAKKILGAIGLDHRIGHSALRPGLPYSGPCVQPETLVQTNSGLEQIDTLEVGDKVLGHDGKYHSVTQIYRRPYCGEMIKIIAEGFPNDPLILTPGHPVWSAARVSSTLERFYFANGTKRLNYMIKPGPFDFRAAEQLKVGDALALPSLKVSEICPQFMNLTSSKNVGRPSPAAKIHLLDEEFFYTLGWYLAEGCASHGEIKLSLHKKEKTYAEQIGSVWKRRLGVETRIKSTGGKGIWTRTGCRPFCNYLRNTFGCHSFDKRVPHEWLGLPEAQLRALIRGMWYGDGSNSCGIFTWASVSLDLFNFMKLAFMRFKIPFRTKKCKAHIDKWGIRHREAYYFKVTNPIAYKAMNELLPDLKVELKSKGRKTVWWENDQMLYHIRKIERVPYDGEVFNLEVETVESYVLEGGAVHNCFPRDNRMFKRVAEQVGERALLAEATDCVNLRILRSILTEVPDHGNVGILGLAYKPGGVVDDDSPGKWWAHALRSAGRSVKTHDPLIQHTSTLEEVLACPTVIVACPWPEYKQITVKPGTKVLDPSGEVKVLELHSSGCFTIPTILGTGAQEIFNKKFEAGKQAVAQ